MYTILAIIITLIPCGFLVMVETREEERKKRLEEEKVQQLKFFLNKCAEARRKNDE